MTLEPRKSCNREDCSEPRYGTLTICRIHNNELQRERYHARKAANPVPPPPPKPRLVWCKDCIDAGVEAPMERLPFTSYCQPHRSKRTLAYYHARKELLQEKLDNMTDDQREEHDRREYVKAAMYEYEWEQEQELKASDSEYLQRIRNAVK